MAKHYPTTPNPKNRLKIHRQNLKRHFYYWLDHEKIMPGDRIYLAMLLLRDSENPPIDMIPVSAKPREIRHLPDDLAGQLDALNEGIDKLHIPDEPQFYGLDDDEDENVRVIRPG